MTENAYLCGVELDASCAVGWVGRLLVLLLLLLLLLWVWVRGVLLAWGGGCG